MKKQCAGRCKYVHPDSRAAFNLAYKSSQCASNFFARCSFCDHCTIFDLPTYGFPNLVALAPKTAGSSRGGKRPRGTKARCVAAMAPLIQEIGWNGEPRIKRV
jgi:hypothetical protein